jgi:hypothetical protein
MLGTAGAGGEVYIWVKALARTMKDQDTILSILKLYQSLEELKDLSPLIALLR